MQVSNSTGRNTDYRVGVSGGGGGNFSFAATSGSPTPCLLDGQLTPGGSELCADSGSWPCTVEFIIDGTLVASQSFSEDPGQVALVESNGQFSIEISPVATDDGPATTA